MDEDFYIELEEKTFEELKEDIGSIKDDFSNDNYKYYKIKKSDISKEKLDKISPISTIYRKKDGIIKETKGLDITKISKMKHNIKIYRDESKNKYSYLIEMPHYKVTKNFNYNRCIDHKDYPELFIFIKNTLENNKDDIDIKIFIERDINNKLESKNLYDTKNFNTLKDYINSDYKSNVITDIRLTTLNIDGSEILIPDLLNILLNVQKNKKTSRLNTINSKYNCINNNINNSLIKNIINLSITDEQFKKYLDEQSEKYLDETKNYELLNNILTQLNNKCDSLNLNITDLLDKQDNNKLSLLDLIILIIYITNELTDKQIENIINNNQKSLILAGSGHINAVIDKLGIASNTKQLKSITEGRSEKLCEVTSEEQSEVTSEEKTDECILDIEKLLIGDKFFPFLDKRVVFGVNDL